MSGRNAPNSASVDTRPNAMERSRVYREPPPRNTAHSCDVIKAIERKDHGTRGIPMPLLVNWFRIHFKKTRIYVYKVTMIEEQQQQQGRGRRGPPPKPPSPITQSGFITKIFWETARRNLEKFPNLHRVVFDDFEYAYTPDSVGMGKGARLYCDHPDKAGKRINVDFQLLESFDLDLSGDIDNRNAQCTLIYLKNLTSQNIRYIPSEKGNAREKDMASRFANLDGGMFFIPRSPNAPRIVVQPGVEAWLGLYASVRRMENFSPVINFGLVNKLFVQMELDLISFYLAIVNDTLSGQSLRPSGLNRNSTMDNDNVYNFDCKLKDIYLKCDCVPLKDKDDIVIDRTERHFRFVELKKGSCADREFLNVEDSREREQLIKEFTRRDGSRGAVRRRYRRVRMDEWYAAQGKPLNYPKLPLAVVKSGTKLDLVPMEVLLTHDKPQKYIKLLNFYARMKISRLLARPPTRHHKITNRMVKDKLEYEKDPFMKAMNISIDPKMIECEGRMVEPCTVLAKSESDDSIVKLEMKKETGEFYITKAIETSNKKIRFAVYKLTETVSDDQKREFYQQLVKKCVNRGFNVPESDYERPLYNKNMMIGRDDFRQIATMMEEHRAKFDLLKRTDDEMCLVFLFITKYVDDLYGQIKYLCDIRYGFVSQVVDEETIRKSSTKVDGEIPTDFKSVYHHLCLKLNAKLGGVNQILAEPEEEDDEPEYGRMPTHEKTMFIGIDVIHPSPNSPITDCSIAAIVASMDKNAAKYAVRIKVNTRCNESVQHFDEHFAILLAKYKSVNGYLPERIVILRDGVSDSQMEQVASEELNSIMNAWKKTVPGTKCPPFTYIIAQKNHKTRFYQRPEDGEVKNPPMGTIVDKDVVTPHMFDFYMVSHYTHEGTTTRPIHYTVVYDDYKSGADAIQELIFRLCFLYARCSKPVSLPSPVYYAHLACERAAYHHQFAQRSGEYGEIMDRGVSETDQDYATRVEFQAMKIGKELQVSEKYPGMYFI